MSSEITLLLKNWRNGDAKALDNLIACIYNDLHKIAIKRLLHERPDHTLQATALVHEAYMRLAEWQQLDWQSRSHFLGITAQIMRNILVDYARKHQAEKRGGDRVKISLSAVGQASKEEDVDLVALDNALQKLATIDPQQSRIIELRYFAGLNIDEVAEVLGISPTTVSREWKLSKIWLKRELSKTI